MVHGTTVDPASNAIREPSSYWYQETNTVITALNAHAMPALSEQQEGLASQQEEVSRPGFEQSDSAAAAQLAHRAPERGASAPSPTLDPSLQDRGFLVSDST